MTDKEQTDAFAADLAALVSRYCAEFNLTTATAVGVLEIQKIALIHNALAVEEDEE